MSMTVFRSAVFDMAAFEQICGSAATRAKEFAGNCAIAWANCGPVADMVSTIVIRFGFQFMAALAFPKIAMALPQPVWDMAGIVLDKAKISLKDKASRIAFQQLKEQNGALQQKVQEMVKQIDGFQMDKDRLSWELSQAAEEKKSLFKEREALTLSKAPLFIEIDQLQEKTKQLICERDAAIEENQKLKMDCEESLRKQLGLESSYRRSLEEQGELQVLLDQVEDYKELNQHLERFHEMYTQLQDRGEEGATLLALKKLLPSYESHREKLHKVLQGAIDELPESDLRRASLRGILRISKEEMEHVKKISETCHLLEELRKPIGAYFSQAQILKKGRAAYG